jgi:Alpha amylase, catalytic domain
MPTPRYPSLYQVNTRVWLNAYAKKLGHAVTLDDIPDGELDAWAKQGFDWIWLLSVWQTGEEARTISRTNTDWRHEFQETLPDLQESDIGGSGFAITAYEVHHLLGGNAALARFRERMIQRGMKLMLDFVPNHMGLGHPWLETHPHYFITGSDAQLTQEPHNYCHVCTTQCELIFAYGRDPYFAGWPDTLQLDYSHAETQLAMQQELLKIATLCDGVRCDMAMLLLPEVFERTWGKRMESFWPVAISAVRQHYPQFCFMAEVYWDLEWSLQQQGFDYTYDKRLYDRLREQNVKAIREHFWADLSFQNKLARFLENHDEPRAAATFPLAEHMAAAVLTYLSPGLRFFHQGQMSGCQKKISPHLIRGPVEAIDPLLASFYDRLLKVLSRLEVREGVWQLIDCVPGWSGNDTHPNFICFAWTNAQHEYLVITVNYSSQVSQAHVLLPFSTELQNATWQFYDLLSNDQFIWQGNDLQARGLFLNEQPWQARVFKLQKQ